jgi:hypothetical protein
VIAADCGPAKRLRDQATLDMPFAGAVAVLT